MEQLNITTEILDADEARRRIPRIRPHLETLMITTRRIKRLYLKLHSGGPPSDSEQEVAKGHLAKLERSWRRSLKAINELGAYVKDPQTGLIDFYSWHGDELVFLCWKYGEEDIRYWHGLEDGFSGRQPISE